MRKEFLFAGKGEQGIQLMGKVFKQALHSKGYNVAKDENYGPEAKGGKSFCEIVIRDSDYPNLLEADLFAVLSQEGYDALKDGVKKDGIIIYDPALVEAEPGGNVYPVPVSEIAARIKGRINMVLLGVVLALTELVSIEDVCLALKEEDKFSEANQRSLEEGYKIGKEYLMKTKQR